MWELLCRYAKVFDAYVHDDYFRNVLCLVFDTIGWERGTIYKGVEMIDVDVAIRNAGGLYNNENLSLREQKRLHDFHTLSVFDKMERAELLKHLGYQIPYGVTYNEHEYPFAVTRVPHLQPHPSLKKVMQFKHQFLRTTSHIKDIAVVWYLGFLDYATTDSVLIWACASRCCETMTVRRLCTDLELYQKHAKLCCAILTKK